MKNMDVYSGERVKKVHCTRDTLRVDLLDGGLLPLGLIRDQYRVVECEHLNLFPPDSFWHSANFLS